jgi:hypothetical protein
LTSKSRHSQRGVRLGYKPVDGIKKESANKKAKGWVDAGPNWKPTKKRKSKSPHSKLVDDLDIITSLIIRRRDGRCVQCGSRDRPTNGHVFPGRYLFLRWDIRPDGQCHQQCWPCNYRHVNHQSDYYEWYINKFGLERFKELKREYYGSEKHWSDKEMRELLVYLKQYYAEMPPNPLGGF